MRVSRYYGVSPGSIHLRKDQSNGVLGRCHRFVNCCEQGVWNGARWAYQGQCGKSCKLILRLRFTSWGIWSSARPFWRHCLWSSVQISRRCFLIRPRSASDWCYQHSEDFCIEYIKITFKIVMFCYNGPFLTVCTTSEQNWSGQSRSGCAMSFLQGCWINNIIIWSKW